MSKLMASILFFVIICVVIAVGVWQLAKSKIKTNQANSESISKEKEYVSGRRSMQFGDWMNMIVLVILGVLLGVAIDGLVRLLTTAFWPVAVIIPFLFISVLLLGELFDGFVDRIFPSGIRPARKPKTANRTPLLRLLSLPIGFMVGITLARLGFSDAILKLL